MVTLSLRPTSSGFIRSPWRMTLPGTSARLAARPTACSAVVTVAGTSSLFGRRSIARSEAFTVSPCASARTGTTASKVSVSTPVSRRGGRRAAARLEHGVEAARARLIAQPGEHELGTGARLDVERAHLVVERDRDVLRVGD